MSRWSTGGLALLLTLALASPAAAHHAFEIDEDGDGWPAEPAPPDPPTPHDPHLGRSWDCNDYDPSTHPGALEECDPVDHDCDGEPITDDCLDRVDADRDGLDAADGDCDDFDPEVGPEAEERCNGVDDDCDEDIDEDCGEAGCTDLGGGGVAFGLLLLAIGGPRRGLRSSDSPGRRRPDRHARKLLGLLVLITGCSVPPDRVGSRIYYVGGEEHGADDGNDGLAPTAGPDGVGPFATIAHATALMVAGDTTYLRAAVYSESNIHFGASGTEAEPIVLAAYAPDEPERPVIDGSLVVGGPSPGIRIAASSASGWVQPGFLRIEGLDLTGHEFGGIATEWNTETPYRGISIVGVDAYFNGLDGIRLAAVHGFVVEDVECSANTGDGLAIVGNSPGSGGALAAQGGQVMGAGLYSNAGRGLSVAQGVDVAVLGNALYWNGGHGLEVGDWPRNDGTDVVSADVLVRGNFAVGNLGAGFLVGAWSHDVVFALNYATENSDGFRAQEGGFGLLWQNNTAEGNDEYGFLVREPSGAVLPPSFAPAAAELRFVNNLAWGNGDVGWPSAPALAVEGRRDRTGEPAGARVDEWLVLVAKNNDFGGRSGEDPWGAPFDDKIVIGVGSLDRSLAAAFGGGALTQAEVDAGAFDDGQGRTGTLARDPGFEPIDPEDPDQTFLFPTDPALIDAGVETDLQLPFCGLAPDLGAIEVCW